MDKLLLVIFTATFAAVDCVLTPEGLVMKRTDIALNDKGIFVFNGRGQISLRDKTITGVRVCLCVRVCECVCFIVVAGLQKLTFPPVDSFTYRFHLNFEEEGVVYIQDFVGGLCFDRFVHCVADIAYDAFAVSPQTSGFGHPLGFNFLAGQPFVPVWQGATWSPNALQRKGTFHKRIKDVRGSVSAC